MLCGNENALEKVRSRLEAKLNGDDIELFDLFYFFPGTK